MTRWSNLFSAAVVATLVLQSHLVATEPLRPFDAETDLISLHYDHAPDKDDGHSAAADVAVLGVLFDADWIKRHAVAVSGAYGRNKPTFNPASDVVMDAAWNERGGWLAAHDDWDEAVEKLTGRWQDTIKAGGHIYVKEGGQSDISMAVMKRIQKQSPDVDLAQVVHVVQHSNWNEEQTTEEALAFVRKAADYVRIRDANAYLNVAGGDSEFEAAALADPATGDAWRAAFDYYSPRERLDFSDTGELFAILNLGELSIDEFRGRSYSNHRRSKNRL